MGPVAERLDVYLKKENIGVLALSEALGYTKPEKIYRLFREGDSQPSVDILTDITNKFENLSVEWLLTGRGKMIKTPMKKRTNENDEDNALIPLYDDVSTIGGINMVAEDRPVYGGRTDNYIDVGDLFPGATAAIRHYNDSMIQYPSGCILAIKEITRPFSFIWGENYVIEFDGYRVTKRVQRWKEGITACSSNEAKDSTGRLIHEPLNIKTEQITKVFLVLGHIVRGTSSAK